MGTNNEHEPQAQRSGGIKYEGDIYGKIGNRFVKLRQTSETVDALEARVAELEFRGRLADDNARPALNIHTCPIGHRFAAAYNHPAKNEAEWLCPNCMASELATAREHIRLLRDALDFYAADTEDDDGRKAIEVLAATAPMKAIKP